ncbi:DarT ssDNA thymidine ADP-ribosyltransferase family protein [Roseovarius mucosus]|uniref:DarT ssDNA thymidine ADP-ribosyltransferase family protein n=1 Tax=Roseovarius mucosus TaxID=215743 RepID=UPI003BA87A10
MLHFTFEKNLPSILSHGLLPAEDLDRRDDIEAFVCDPYREDGQLDCICLTVTRYQQAMFRRVKRDYRDAEWVILVIHPAVLWENTCLFCDGNASSSWIKNTWRNLSTAFAFEAMFEDYHVTRKQDGVRVNASIRALEALPDSVPTDPQSEVLVRARIPLDRIAGVWVETAEQGERIKAMLQLVPENDRPDVFVEEYSFNACDGI